MNPNNRQKNANDASWSYITWNIIFYIVSSLIIYGIDPLVHIPGHSLTGHFNIQFLLAKIMLDVYLYCLAKRWRRAYYTALDFKSIAVSMATSIAIICAFFIEVNYSVDYEYYHTTLRFPIINYAYTIPETTTDYYAFRWSLCFLASVWCPVFILFT